MCYADGTSHFSYYDDAGRWLLRRGVELVAWYMMWSAERRLTSCQLINIAATGTGLAAYR